MSRPLPFTTANDIIRFCKNYPDDRIVFYLHTSVIVIPEYIIWDLIIHKPKNAEFFLPLETKNELLLLSKCSHYEMYRKKASILLSRIGDRPRFSTLSSIFFNNRFDKAVFVFCDPSATRGFTQKICSKCSALSSNIYTSRIYHLNYIPSLTYKNIELKSNISPIKSEVPYIRTSNPLRIRYMRSREEIKKNIKSGRYDVRNSKGRTNMYFNASELEFVTEAGEAVLFRTSVLPGKILKIFKFYTDKAFTEKLLMLADLYGKIPAAVMPEYLLYKDDKCVGYVMEELKGTNLYVKLPSMTDYEINQFIKEFTVTLLEMRTKQFHITDISLTNIFICKDGTMRLIDCDSMEFGSYPGGGITEPFGHPDAEPLSYKGLRLPEHINFSYAVLLFKLITGIDHPLIQCNAIEKLEWKKNKFPYANNDDRQGIAAPGQRPNLENLANWNNEPYVIRAVFCDVFNFREIHSIGSWISVLRITRRINL